MDRTGAINPHNWNEHLSTGEPSLPSPQTCCIRCIRLILVIHVSSLANFIYRFNSLVLLQWLVSILTHKLSRLLHKLSRLLTTFELIILMQIKRRVRFVISKVRLSTIPLIMPSCVSMCIPILETSLQQFCCNAPIHGWS